MEEKRVKLNSRYHIKNYLEKIDEHKWVLKSDEEGHIRLGLNSKDYSKYEFIDPAGGPFMAVNYPIEEINEILKSIDFVEGVGYVLTTRANEDKE